MFMHVFGKMGNMKKAVEWIIYPLDANTPNERLIQSDKRIARVNLETKQAILSSGKKGNGFLALSPVFGAIKVDVPADILTQLNEASVPIGEVAISSLINRT